MEGKGFFIPFTELTRHQVAEMFMVSPSTIDRWCKKGLVAKGHTFHLQKSNSGKFRTADIIKFHEQVNTFKKS